MSIKKKANSQFHVVVTGPQIAKEADEYLAGKCSVEYTQPYMEPSKLVEKIRNEMADALLVRMGNITAEVIQASPELKVISKHGTGVDNIDIATASEHNIPVMIATYANYESVAEHALGLMLAVAKDINRLDARIRQGYWDKPSYRGSELHNKTLGLVGFGRTGRRLKELVAPLEMKILVYDPFLKDEKKSSHVTVVSSFEELLKFSDIVSLHCSLTGQTRHLISKPELKTMKKTAWLINTARGAIVDQEALIEALKTGEIAAAGLDTFEKEPLEDNSALIDTGKTVLTPHIAGATSESFVRMGMDAARNILSVLEGKPLDSECVVNPDALKKTLRLE
jgi:D-3-phosphoglycerate dehydrogenase